MRKTVVLLTAIAALWAAPGAFAAGWCGTGASPADRPDITTGPQVHAIWAAPSDVGDTFAAGAPKLADDIASFTSWWAGQDPTRVPRLDNAAFPTGSCVDISSVRLPRPAATYAGANGAFSLLSRDLVDAGFSNPFKAYLVYYDGPSVQTNVCGTGGGDFNSGPSFAVVWLAGCPNVPDDGVAAHELLHALGALPAGAPHACPGDSGHPCDSPQDILFPYNSGTPLSQLFLDFNHDDYYGHSGTWVDIQDSLWLHRLDLPAFPLSVAFSGAGTVHSDVPGVDCTQVCTTQWDSGAQLVLTPVGAAQTRFVRWQGACTGTLDCALTMTAARSVSAVFGPLRIHVKVATTGRGQVVCTPRCATTANAGTALSLRAVAAKGWRFASWSGGCTGTRPTCRPKTDFALTVRATFRKR